jgi:MerR family mercuric resistance operon transcriptional regulator
MLETVIAIGELSRQTGCNIETIRYYEHIGLLPKPDRRGRHRAYGFEDIGRLRFICRSRELGFTLNDVRALLRLATGGQAACCDVQKIAAAHLEDVRSRLSDLRRMELVLAEAITRCEAGDDKGCPLIDTLAAHGSA